MALIHTLHCPAISALVLLSCDSDFRKILGIVLAIFSTRYLQREKTGPILPTGNFAWEYVTVEMRIEDIDNDRN